MYSNIKSDIEVHWSGNTSISWRSVLPRSLEQHSCGDHLDLMTPANLIPRQSMSWGWPHIFSFSVPLLTVILSIVHIILIMFFIHDSWFLHFFSGLWCHALSSNNLHKMSGFLGLLLLATSSYHLASEAVIHSSMPLLVLTSTAFKWQESGCKICHRGSVHHKVMEWCITTT